MKTGNRILHWLPRILCIMAILFVSMFALDAFDPQLTIWQQIKAFFMHLIPSFILIVMLLVAWKWELIGGILLALTGLIMTPFVFNMNYNMNHSVLTSMIIILIITFPFVLTGILFIVDHYTKTR